MSNSTHQFKVKGVDASGKAFDSIAARARATGASIRAALGGALAAAGAYLSLRSIKGGIDELGNLSDLAMKAGTSVDTLTKSALAFQVAGLNLPVESLARSFQYLKKQTGEGGMDNFFKVAGEIAKIDNAAERGAALVKNFGRSGLELQPLIDGGEAAISKMQTLAEVMPGVSQSAADAGDETSDSMKILGSGIHTVFLEVIGNLIGMFSKDLPGGMRAGALSAANWLMTFAKKAKATLVVIGANIGAFGGLLVDGFMPAIKLVGAGITKVFSTVKDSIKYVGTSILSTLALVYDTATKGPKVAWETFKGTMSQANSDFAKGFFDTSDFDGPMAQLKQAGDIFSDTLAQADKAFQASMGAADKGREEYLAKLKTLNVNDLAGALGGGGKSAAPLAEEIGTTVAKAAQRVTNQLMLSGSSAANRLAVLGPEYQNETKKQTDLLRKIAQNTEKTAENTDEIGDSYTPTDL